MALTTTQVNAAFLATLGRPAEGSAATWGSTLSLDTLLDSIFIAENTDGDFVEYLYQNILGRPSDAEGKAFWNSLLATTSKEAVLAQFKAAVADPSNADYKNFIAKNKAFVTDLYTNLLGRSDAASADAEGVEFWANALASGTSRGDLLAQFTAAAMANPNSADTQVLSAKINVANAITAKFNNFNADVTADEKKVALDALKTTMTEVVAGSTIEDFQERIDTFAGNYQNKVPQVFTKPTNDKPTDSLDSSEAAAATVFSGDVNLINTNNGTIQRGDSVAGNSNYTDTLRVSVTSDSANKEFDLGNHLPGTVSSVEKLIITAGAANVSGTLDGSKYADSAIITSTGDVDLKISGDQSELTVTAGDKKEATITVNSGSLDNYTGSAAKDTIIVNAGKVKTIDTGAGKDTVEIKDTGSIQNEGSINLGAGDDELTIAATLTKSKTLNKISLDGGEGSKDKLTISTDITAVDSITGFETINATTGAKISADAANSLTSGAKLSDSSDLIIAMSDKNSLNLKNLKVDNTADNKLGKASVTIDGVAKGEITLTSTTNNAIVETITLAKTEDGKTGSVTINKIGAAKLGGEVKDPNSSGDKLKIADTTIESGNPIKLAASVDAGDTQALNANSLYYVNTAISSADDLASKSTVLNLGLTLATGSKALVALNNSAQNKSYIYEITGNNDGLTRDNITLKAIVDNAINKYDVITDNAIEFVAGRETDDASGKVLAYSGTSIDLSTGKYTVYGESEKTFTPNTQKLIITDISGDLTISSGSNTIDAFVTTASGKVKKGAGADNATINIHLGGTETAGGTIISGDQVLNFNVVENNAIASGAANLYANVSGATITFKDAKTTFGENLKLDLGNVNADIKFGTTNEAKIDLTTLVTGENASDKVAVTGGSNTTQVVGTKAADTITMASNAGAAATISLGAADGAADIVIYAAGAIASFKGDTINNFGSEDKIDVKAAVNKELNLEALDTKKTNLADGKFYTANIDRNAQEIVADKNLIIKNGDGTGILNGTAASAASNAKALLVVTSSDNKSLVYSIINGADTTLTTGEVGLVAIVDNDTLALSNFITQ